MGAVVPKVKPPTVLVAGLPNVDAAFDEIPKLNPGVATVLAGTPKRVLPVAEVVGANNVDVFVAGAPNERGGPVEAIEVPKSPVEGAAVVVAAPKDSPIFVVDVAGAPLKTETSFKILQRLYILNKHF